MKTVKHRWKGNKGFTTADLAVAVVILMIFVSLIATAFYHYYMSVTQKNRSAMATNCAIDVIEQTKKMNYEEVTQESINQLIENLKKGIEIESGNTIFIPEPYEVTAQLEKYNETQGNTAKQDLIKRLTVTVQYVAGNKTETIQMSKLITK